MRRLLWALALVALPAMVRPAAAAVDHSAWNALVQQHVRDGRVDYAAVKADPRLDQYLALLAGADLAGLRDEHERLALYLNAYNAFVVKGIAERWPLDSVAKVPDFFNRVNWRLGGRDLTLDALVGDLLRPLREPRVHAALACGAVGCAPLRGEAYDPGRIDAQLDDQARRWVNDAARNRIDRAGNKLLLSMTFKWYLDDFEHVGGPAGFVRRYVNDEADRTWIGGGAYDVDYLKFDWSVNGRG